MTRVFQMVLKAEGMPQPVTEHRFHSERKWRFDYAWPSDMLALEVEGGAWVGGRHTRGAGFINDLEKYNTALVMGWRVLRVTPDQLVNGTAVDYLKQALNVNVGG